MLFDTQLYIHILLVQATLLICGAVFLVCYLTHSYIYLIGPGYAPYLWSSVFIMLFDTQLYIHILLVQAVFIMLFDTQLYIHILLVQATLLICGAVFLSCYLTHSYIYLIGPGYASYLWSSVFIMLFDTQLYISYWSRLRSLFVEQCFYYVI